MNKVKYKSEMYTEVKAHEKELLECIHENKKNTTEYDELMSINLSLDDFLYNYNLFSYKRLYKKYQLEQLINFYKKIGCKKISYKKLYNILQELHYNPIEIQNIIEEFNNSKVIQMTLTINIFRYLIFILFKGYLLLGDAFVSILLFALEVYLTFSTIEFFRITISDNK